MVANARSPLIRALSLLMTFRPNDLIITLTMDAELRISIHTSSGPPSVGPGQQHVSSGNLLRLENLRCGLNLLSQVLRVGQAICLNKLCITCVQLTFGDHSPYACIVSVREHHLLGKQKEVSTPMR